ncbi:MAG: acyl--CoA ligase [Gammaproteobacteria bacterium]|nr:acyl--CoA ligase [Gammaproteobacteria bacterium]
MTPSLLARLDARRTSDRHAAAVMSTDGRILSVNDFSSRIRTIARGFAAAGLKSGERVLFAVRPDIDAIILMLGIAEAGGVLVPVDTNMGPALFESRMKSISPSWVVAESILYSLSASRWIRSLLSRRGINLPRLGAVRNARFVHVGRSWPGVPAGKSAMAIEMLGLNSRESTAIDDGDNAAVMMVFTSGTSGEPKAVVHTRRSMRGVFDTIDPLLDAHGGDCVYSGELHLILPALFAGASVVIPCRTRFSAKRVLADMERFRVTHFFEVSAEFQQLVDGVAALKKTLPETLRQIWIGAAPVRATLLRNCKLVLAKSTRVWCVYGMTEVLPVARVSLDEKVQYDGAGDLVGPCVDGVVARISEDGELLLRGPNLCSGYFGESPLQELATGDLARFDDGRIVLLGRRKDMIIRGQFNIYPELYESTIEGIAGVTRCAMVGFYDEAAADEKVLLVIQPVENTHVAAFEERLWRELQSGPNSIDPAALPDTIVFMTLPMCGRSSKVDKQRLREFAMQLPCASQ